MFNCKLETRCMKLLALLALAAPLLAGCDTLMPGQVQMSQDVLEIKTRLNQSIAKQESTERSLNTSINSLSENLDKSINLNNSNMDELNRRVGQQGEEMNKLRGEVETLNANIKSQPPQAGAGSYGGMTGGATTTDTTGTAPGVGTNPLNPGATAPTGAAADTLRQATELYNSGQYAQAKEAFVQALSQNLEGDMKVDAEFGLGETCYKLQDLSGAKQSYLDAIRAKRSAPKAWVSLERVADIDLTQGNREEAISYYEHIIKNKPTYPDIASVQRKLEAARSNKGVDLTPQQ